MGWNPWRALRERDDVELVVVELKDRTARWDRAGDGRHRVSLDYRLKRRDRSDALAHELVHAEREVGFPDATAGTMELEEERVRRITAERVVPLDTLRKFVYQRALFQGIDAQAVAEEFDVSLDVARLALWLLHQQDLLAGEQTA